MESIDTDRHSGGILTAWSPELKLISATRYGLVLGTHLEDGEMCLSYTILNVYGPFYDKKSLWETVGKTGAADQTNVILGGDLNLTLSTNEILGKNARTDAPCSFFSLLFE